MKTSTVGSRRVIVALCVIAGTAVYAQFPVRTETGSVSSEMSRIRVKPGMDSALDP